MNRDDINATYRPDWRTRQHVGPPPTGLLARVRAELVERRTQRLAREAEQEARRHPKEAS